MATESEQHIIDRMVDFVGLIYSKNVNEITMNSSLIGDLSGDIYCAAELKFAVEDEFNITISDEELESFTTVGDVVRHILNRQA